jgi:hypothetical protein
LREVTRLAVEDELHSRRLTDCGKSKGAENLPRREHLHRDPSVRYFAAIW